MARQPTDRTRINTVQVNISRTTTAFQGPLINFACGPLDRTTLFHTVVGLFTISHQFEDGFVVVMVLTKILYYTTNYYAGLTLIWAERVNIFARLHEIKN